MSKPALQGAGGNHLHPHPHPPLSGAVKELTPSVVRDQMSPPRRDVLKSWPQAPQTVILEKRSSQRQFRWNESKYGFNSTLCVYCFSKRRGCRHSRGHWSHVMSACKLPCGCRQREAVLGLLDMSLQSCVTCPLHDVGLLASGFLYNCPLHNCPLVCMGQLGSLTHPLSLRGWQEHPVFIQL